MNILGTNSTNNGVNSWVYALEMNGTNQLFVGGNFGGTGRLGTTSFKQIASWDGTSWNALGDSTYNGVNGWVNALAMNGTNQLFVGGYFATVAGGLTSAYSIASWNGNSWNFLGTNSTYNGVSGNGTYTIVFALAMNGTNNLFVGGEFTSANGGLINANNIASWNGNSWNFLGTDSSNNGVDNIVYALAMNGTNNLFVGGSFSHVDGSSISVNYIASWNGNSWNILGTSSTNNGVGGIIHAVVMNGTNNLFVGGSFSNVSSGAISANNIASWDGNSWNILGTTSINNGVNGPVYAFTMNGTNNLFVGGSFSSADGNSILANNFASWDGSLWSFDIGVSNSIDALAMNGTSGLFIGGYFAVVDGICASQVAELTTSPPSRQYSNWSSVGAGTSYLVYAVAMNGTNNLFVGGEFLNVGESTLLANHIASWNGNSWKFLGTDSRNNGVDNTVYALAMNGTNQLFVGGSFQNFFDVGGLTSANHVASWNGNSWSFLGTDSINNGVTQNFMYGTVYALAMNGTNQLFVGGSFTNANGNSIPAYYVASWNGSSWNFLGTDSTYNGVGSINSVVYALVMNGTNNLFVGGYFAYANGSSISANSVASWDGNSWNILGSDSTNNGVGSGSSTVYALAMNGKNNLFVGGSFTSVDGSTISANNIASWNGNSWNILGTSSVNNGVDNTVRAFAMNGTNTLFVGGQFQNFYSAGTTIPASYIAYWNGNSWGVLGTNTTNGVDNGIRALLLSGSTLYVGGEFSQTNDGSICSSYLSSFDAGNKMKRRQKEFFQKRC